VCPRRRKGESDRCKTRCFKSHPIFSSKVAFRGRAQENSSRIFIQSKIYHRKEPHKQSTYPLLPSVVDLP
jgi:hypothetical protein